MTALLVCGLLTVLPVFGQGVAVPKRFPKAGPDIKPSAHPPKVQFQDIAAASGLNFRHVTGDEAKKDYIIETTGSGIALIDYDNDGWLDIFFVNGTTLSGFQKGKEPFNHLYHNNKNGTFIDVTESANLIRTGWGQGVCVGDYDNDGFDDLLVTYFGQNVLYRNDGKGHFVDVTEKAGLSNKAERWGTGCSFFDYDKDGDLDLFIANYVDFNINKIPAKGSSQFCQWKGLPVMCGPRGLLPATNLLYRNNGDGTFTDVSEKSGITKPGGRYAFTSLVSDYDNDGWPDIYVACDSAPNILYHNNHDGTFSDNGFTSGTALNEDGQEQAGMGVSAADYDHDGFLDIVKTNFEDDTTTLYRNNGDGTFDDVTFSSRLGVNTRYLGWGVGFIDFDNDGWKDIFLVNGHVYPEVEAQGVSRYKQESLLYWNMRDGTFLDVSANAGPGFTTRKPSRGAAAGDLDNDGSPEIVINNINDVPSLLKNSGERKNWIIIKLAGTRSNRDGIGARVVVVSRGVKQTDEVRSGGSYISQNDLRLHFGLGDAQTVDRIEVTWPSGTKDIFQNQKGNQVLVLQEGKAAPGASRVDSKRSRSR